MSDDALRNPLNEPLLRVPVDEDAGALTQARYGFQWNCAVPFILHTMDENAPVRAVVCETHEDFVVLHAHGPELVSVKHRELSQQPWTLRELVDGALGHLVRRWLETGRRARCRLMTNHGLRPGKEEAGGLEKVCAADESDGLDEWAKRLAERMNLNENAARHFLGGLTLEPRLPGRDHIADIFRVHKLRPIMRRLGLGVDADVIVYGRLLGQVAQRSADRTWSPEALLEAMVEPDGRRAVAVLRRRISQRTVDADDVAGCLRGLPTGSMRLGGAEGVPAPTRLVQKLEAGQVGPTAVRSAQRLRADWYQLEARWRGLPGGGEEFVDLRTRSQALAARVESEVMRPQSYGRAMHARLTERLAAGELVQYAPFALDRELLLGLMFQLTDECEIWWSPQSTVC